MMIVARVCVGTCRHIGRVLHVEAEYIRLGNTYGAFLGGFFFNKKILTHAMYD